MIARMLAVTMILSTAPLAEAVAAPASENTATPAETVEADAPVQPEDERKVCRSEKVTGSLTRRSRVCLTVAQWRELEIRNQLGLNDFNRSASGSSVNRSAEMTYGSGGIDQYTGQPNQ